MPDLIGIVNKRWKSITALTIAASLLALIISILLPKEYMSAVTAVPANSALSDKARMFNNNFETLYPELGATDELDRIEGTARLDTIYLFVAGKNDLVDHYGFNQNAEGLYKAAIKLKKQTDIRRSAYGELKIKVWDKDPYQAALLANAVFNELNDIYQQAQRVNNVNVLAQLRSNLSIKQQTLDSFSHITASDEGSRLNATTPSSDHNDTIAVRQESTYNLISNFQILRQEVADYQRIIPQYEMALHTSMQPLIAVENARPAFYPDKPKVMLTVIFAFGAAFVFSLLLAVFTEHRKQEL